MENAERKQIDPLWTADQVADYLQVSPQTVEKWAKNGDIPVRKAGRLNRFAKEDIDRWTQKRAEAAGEVA